MKNKKNIIIILGIVLLFGLILEIARTEYLFNLGRNDNDYSFNHDFQRADSITDDEIDKIVKERFLVVYDSDEDRSIKIKDNTVKVLEYMKKDYIIYDCKDYKGIDDEYSGVIITFESLRKLPGLDGLMEYASEGGRVFLAERPLIDGAFLSIYRKLGIYEAENTVSEYGIKMISNILLKGKGYAVDGNFIGNNFISLRLKKECNVHAISQKNIPLLWDVTYDKGKFVVFNGTMLDLRINRGIIAGAVSLLNDDFIYPVMNMKLTFIDDFPAPVPKGYIDNIYKGYGRNISNFYREVWWSDILKGAKKYHLKYSGMIIETYNQRVKPPFKDNSGTDVNNLIIYGREVIKSGGELGIHGYNHQPLADPGYIQNTESYRPWDSEEDMIASLREINDYIGVIYPRYKLRSYVPPSNILSPVGREALINALPDLNIISSLYLDDFIGDAYVQEFEVGKNNIIELPRITSGYDDNQENNWATLNSVTSIGVFSHFIHPDDVIDPDRNEGKTWDQLSKEYDLLLKKVYENYGWLRGMTVSQGGYEVDKYSQSDVYVEHKENFINVYCRNFVKDMYFILRSNKKVIVKTDFEISNIDEGVYLIYAKKPAFTIELR